MNEQLQVLFKTRGGHKEGMGDITSSLALAKEFQRRGHETFFVINDNPHVAELISGEDFSFVIEDEFYRFKSKKGQSSDIVIANQLNTPLNEILQLKKITRMLVTIDDTGEASRLADIRFNVLYPIEDSIYDFKYIPLETNFQQKHEITANAREHINNILITQGGSDTYGFTPMIVKALHCLPADICCNIVLGPNYIHFNQLQEALQGIRASINIIKGEKDLSNLMLEADLAISAGGNTLFELACLGVPTIVLCGEPFEVATADRLQKAGFGINLGFGEQVTLDQIQEALFSIMENTGLRWDMGSKGKKLIDGRGIERLVNVVLDTHFNKSEY